MTENCPSSQMTGFKFNAYSHYQNVIVYVNNFGLYRKTVSLILICSVSVCTSPYTDITPLPYMVWGYPESDRSLKEVSAYIIWHRVHTWGFRCHLSETKKVCRFRDNLQRQVYVMYTLGHNSECSKHIYLNVCDQITVPDRQVAG